MEWIIGGLVLLLGSAFGGYWFRELKSRKALRSAEQQSKQILEDASRQAEATAKQAKLESKEHLHTLRQEFEEKTKDRRVELSQLEKRLHQREELLDRKLDLLDHKEKDLADRDKQFGHREQTFKAKDEIEQLKRKRKSHGHRGTCVFVAAARSPPFRMNDRRCCGPWVLESFGVRSDKRPDRYLQASRMLY